MYHSLVFSASTDSGCLILYPDSTTAVILSDPLRGRPTFCKAATRSIIPVSCTWSMSRAKVQAIFFACFEFNQLSSIGITAGMRKRLER